MKRRRRSQREPQPAAAVGTCQKAEAVTRRPWDFGSTPIGAATRRVLCRMWLMDKAIELIVDAYVRLQNRKALEDLRTHRRRLLADLKGRSSSIYDLSG